MPYKILFLKKISLLQVFFLSIFLCGLVYYGVKLNFENKITAQNVDTNTSSNKLNLLRNQNQYRFTKPLFAADIDCESMEMTPIKKQLIDYINISCQSGNLFQGSFYLRNLENGEWISSNNDLHFHPGSLIKLPMLIHYLKRAETDPSILNKKLSIDSKLVGIPDQTFSKHSIEDYKEYTIKELLKYMVAYSDNKATYLLNTNADIPQFSKIFIDLGLAEPNIRDTNYTISVKEYSIFLRVLYNATYLNAENSEFALSLLTQSSFSQGLAKMLPAEMFIARKFGEMKIENKRELHEAGIFYCNNHPYLLTVMTKGYNPQNLAEIISHLSSLTYAYLCI